MLEDDKRLNKIVCTYLNDSGFTAKDCLDAESKAGLRAVDVHITKLSDKFSECGSFKITTVRGLGYKAVLL